MEPSNPFGDEQWPYALRAINYLVRQLRLEDAATTVWEQACLLLHTRLRDGSIRSRWERGQLPPSFWQFAKIDEDGDAVTRSRTIVPVNDPGNPSLRAFNVNAADVLRLWPAAEAGEAAAKGPPVHAETTPVARKTATKLAQVADALKSLWPDYNAPADRKVMRAALEKELKQSFSETTLDRARDLAGFPKLRQKSPNVV